MWHAPSVPAEIAIGNLHAVDDTISANEDLNQTFSAVWIGEFPWAVSHVGDALAWAFNGHCDRACLWPARTALKGLGKK